MNHLLVVEKLLEDRISYIQDTFARLFEELSENGIIPRETYNRLKHLRWIPFKTIESAFNEIKLHMEGRNPEKIGPSIHKPLLKIC